LVRFRCASFTGEILQEEFLTFTQTDTLRGRGRTGRTTAAGSNILPEESLFLADTALRSKFFKTLRSPDGVAGASIIRNSRDALAPQIKKIASYRRQ